MEAGWRHETHPSTDVLWLENISAFTPSFWSGPSSVSQEGLVQGVCVQPQGHKTQGEPLIPTGPGTAQTVGMAQPHLLSPRCPTLCISAQERGQAQTLVLGSRQR